MHANSLTKRVLGFVAVINRTWRAAEEERETPGWLWYICPPEEVSGLIHEGKCREFIRR